MGAGGSSSEHTKSSQPQQTSEVPASVTSESGLSEAVSGNVQVLESTLPDVASVGGDSGINELTSDMSNLSVAGEQLQQVSQSIPSSVSVQASVTNTEADEKLSQESPALTQAKIVDNTKPMSSHSAVSQGAGDASGARPKIVSSREIPKPVFISLVYGNEPDPEPLSIFVNNPLIIVDRIVDHTVDLFLGLIIYPIVDLILYLICSPQSSSPSWPYCSHHFLTALLTQFLDPILDLFVGHILTSFIVLYLDITVDFILTSP